MSSEAASGLGDKETDTGNQSAWKAFGMRFYHEFTQDDLAGMAAEIAYHLIFAIPPLIILTVMAAALLNNFSNLDVVPTFHRLVNQHAPGDLQPVLNSVIDNAVGKVGGGVATLGAILTAILAIWSGSNGVASLMKGFNRAEDVDEGRPYVKKKLLAIGLTIALIVFVIISFALFVFGKEIGNAIAGQVGLSSTFNATWNIARWPVAIGLIMLLLGLLYYYGPALDQAWRNVAIGAVVATLLWIGAVFGFKLYLSLSNPGSAYGAFGGLIVFLFFLYVTSLIFLVGAELNAVLKWMTRHDVAGAPKTARSQTDRGHANEVAAADLGAPGQRRQTENEEPAPRMAQSPRGPASRKEPT